MNLGQSSEFLNSGPAVPSSGNTCPLRERSERNKKVGKPEGAMADIEIEDGSEGEDVDLMDYLESETNLDEEKALVDPQVPDGGTTWRVYEGILTFRH